MAVRITAKLEDVNGSFARLMREAPKDIRAALGQAVRSTAFAVGQRMKANAPVGPEAPHIRDDVEVQSRGMRADVGYLTKPEQAAVAMFNEYSPNKQPFMRAALEDEAGEFLARVRKVLKQVERDLTGGGGLT